MPGTNPGNPCGRRILQLAPKLPEARVRRMTSRFSSAKKLHYAWPIPGITELATAKTMLYFRITPRRGISLHSAAVSAHVRRDNERKCARGAASDMARWCFGDAHFLRADRCPRRAPLFGDNRLIRYCEGRTCAIKILENNVSRDVWRTEIF